MKSSPALTMAMSIPNRAADGASPECMIAFTGLPPEGAIQDAKA